MKINQLHDWDVTSERAEELQKELSEKVSHETTPPIDFIHVCGLDLGYQGNLTKAAAVVTRMDTLGVIVEEQTVIEEVKFPYIPGLLSFREAPVALKALEKLKTVPDVIIVDGHGLCHPRRFGFACHIGLFTGIPTIGVAKTHLCGEYKKPSLGRGDYSIIKDKDLEYLGIALRTKANYPWIYASIGHRVSLSTLYSTVLNCTAPWFSRIPRPICHAHKIVSRK